MASGLSAQAELLRERARFNRGRAESRRNQSRAKGTGAIERKLQHEREQRARNKAKHAKNTTTGVMIGGAALGAGVGGFAAAGAAGGLTGAQGALVGASVGSSTASGLLSGNPNAIAQGIQSAHSLGEGIKGLQTDSVADFIAAFDAYQNNQPSVAIASTSGLSPTNFSLRSGGR